MFEKCPEKFHARFLSLPPPTLEGCVLTSRKHAVNFYVWHVVIDFPAVPETGKPPRRAFERERGRKENRGAELDKVIFQLRQIVVLETIVPVYPIASRDTVLTMSSGEMRKGSNCQRVFGFTIPS